MLKVFKSVVSRRHRAGFTKEQLYSTASFGRKDLQGITLSENDLSGWSFRDQNLQNANLASSILTNANFTSTHLAGVRFDDTVVNGTQLIATTRRGFTPEQLIPRPVTN